MDEEILSIFAWANGVRTDHTPTSTTIHIRNRNPTIGIDGVHDTDVTIIATISLEDVASLWVGTATGWEETRKRITPSISVTETTRKDMATKYTNPKALGFGK